MNDQALRSHEGHEDHGVISYKAGLRDLRVLRDFVMNVASV
jgi:hypothetical protein